MYDCRASNEITGIEINRCSNLWKSIYDKAYVEKQLCGNTLKQQKC